MDMGVKKANYIPGTPFVGADVKMYPGPGGNRGVLTAWDPVARRKVFEIKEDLPLWSPALATAGGLVFYGTMDGWFKAVDARSGKLLWQFKTGSGIIGQPISYRGPDGRQYIAVPSGIGGWAGAIVSADLDERDPTAALGFVNAVKDLKEADNEGWDSLCLRAFAVVSLPWPCSRYSAAAIASKDRRAASRWAKLFRRAPVRTRSFQAVRTCHRPTPRFHL